MAVENSIAKDVATIRESTDDANGDKYDIGHAAALLVMLGEHIGTPGAEYSDLKRQALGARVGYLGQQIQRHVESLGSALEDIETAANGLRGAQ
jgi:hypothetical protein